MSESILDREPPAADLRIRYGPAPCHFGELRLPPGPGPHPCIIAIHGGFWRNRFDLRHLGHLCSALANEGLATWNIEYRRLGDPGGGWPGTFHDVVRAARHLFDIAPRQRIDPDRIFALGHSAGGQLASWLAGIGAVPEQSPIHADPLPLRGVVSLAGVLDLVRGSELNLSDGVVRELLDGGPDDVPERYAAASPRSLLPVRIPHLVVHGVADPVVPVTISEAFHTEAEVGGGASSLLIFPETSHFELIDPRSVIWPELLSAIRSFGE